MPCATRRCDGEVNKSVGPSSIKPLAGMAPMMARNNVVFPAPLRPISPQISPSSSANEASRMTGMGPIDTLRLDTLNMGGTPSVPHPWAADQRLNLGIGQRCGRRPVGDHGAIVKCQYTLGETLDDLHVVLHEKHSDLAVA